MENKMVDLQGMVAEFMLVSGQTVRTRPVSLTMEQAQFRHALYMEEVEELAIAIQDGDRVEQLDALVDILYIVYGTANAEGADMRSELAGTIDAARIYIPRTEAAAEILLTELEELGVRAQSSYAPGFVFKMAKVLGFGLDTVLRAFKRVHDSNMSKFCTTEAEARETVASYKDQGVGAFWAKQSDLYVVYRAYDKKILKSVNYSPVSLKELIN